MRLLIVESPAKAKTINKYLGKDYIVAASYGHIRDLRAKNGSVKPDEEFSMVWEMSDRGEKCLRDISRQLKSCDELLLATDPDREGEAISWHLKEVLDASQKLKIPFRRIVFHEITKSALTEALAHPRDIDENLVDSYLARRALDYLVGFTLSPILWRKLPGSKSAGRVQSVALRIVVDRESEIEQFKTQEFWTVEGQFEAKGRKSFGAKLTHFQGKKLDKFAIANEQSAISIRDILDSQNFVVASVEKKIVKRNPAPPFITSTLQQEASRKLGFSAKKTMQLAQNLYEGVDVDGETQALITYMRTDSTNVSKDALDRVRSLIMDKYGQDFLPSQPRFYKTKVKNAQEAHEAIRPVDAGLTPEQLKGKINSDLFRLYDLVWKRSTASQMSSAEYNQVQADISDTETAKNIFRATGSTIHFEGFLKVYVEGRDEADQPEEAEGMLPPLSEGDVLGKNQLNALQHFTAPPPRFSEASLVKKLEELGIGRPSTYATILQVLRDRGYVKLENKFFVPEVRGRLVTSFLMNFFSKYLEYDFTARLEQLLDDISNGSNKKTAVLGDFWMNFCSCVNDTKSVTISDVIDRLNASLGAFLFPSDGQGGVDRLCPDCRKGELSLKLGKYGSFIGCSAYPECGYIKNLDAQSESSAKPLTSSMSEYPKFIGVDPNDQDKITIRSGPYGLYIQKDLTVQTPPPPAVAAEKPRGKSTAKAAKAGKAAAGTAFRRASIPKSMDPEKIDLDTALWLLSLPKMLGNHDGDEVKVGIGRFGPYILFRKKYVSIKNVDDIMSITLADALGIMAKAEQRPAGGTGRRPRYKKT
ncbi:MAG: type I DNA topoisomerase [Holosporaceae bacterium]|jgi:DNA topoisomerase-1|nr:type I DNA topoisomerase [Holosporaceae bacterium]